MTELQTDLHRETWDIYTLAWQVASAAEKRAIYAECLAPDCEYNDPLARTKGYDELLDYMLDFQRQVPGGRFVVKHFLAHNDQSIACWDMVTGDGTVAGDGISYGKYNAEGKLTAMTGFFEPRP
jgi:hypothetical protein